MSERIIVSLTTYSKRIANLPTVLDTIFSQTHQPDQVVVNLAYDETIPPVIQSYIDTHAIEVFRVPDTKVYKKLIPTLKRYPEDCVITIDDDFLYPQDMIEDLVSTHQRYPNHPVSGNREIFSGMQCHCGCCSLMKADYLGKYMDCIDDDVIAHCPSDDLVYTYMANLNGYPYVRTRGLYFINMPTYNEGESYSQSTQEAVGIYDTFDYLFKRFGAVDDHMDLYVKDKNLSELLSDINKSHYQDGYQAGIAYVCSSRTYKMGKILSYPVSLMRSLGALLFKK